MKTLDEVIEGLESHYYNTFKKYIPDALLYLKMYRSDKLQYEADRKNWNDTYAVKLAKLEDATAKHLAALKDLQQAPSWIPVSERMPENDHTMAVRTVTQKGVVSWNRAWWDGEFWHGSGSMANVTHWMPISTEVA